MKKAGIVRVIDKVKTLCKVCSTPLDCRILRPDVYDSVAKASKTHCNIREQIVGRNCLLLRVNYIRLGENRMPQSYGVNRPSTFFKLYIDFFH